MRGEGDEGVKGRTSKLRVSDVNDSKGEGTSEGEGESGTEGFE